MSPARGSQATAGGDAGLGLRHRRVQRLRRLVHQSSFRDREKAFVLEGYKLLDEAVSAAAPVEGVYLAPGAADPSVDRALAAGFRAFGLAEGVIERVAATSTPQPVMAISSCVDRPLDSLRPARLMVVCVDVRDPGNLGAILRSAEASGVEGVVCCDGTVDVYNPKSVRASAGSLFHVSVVRGGNAVEVLEQIGSWGVTRWASAARDGDRYDRADLRGPTCLVLGNEASGLPPQVAAHVDGSITIPMVGRSESLNVGMAAAVLCFEAARQRATTAEKADA